VLVGKLAQTGDASLRHKFHPPPEPTIASGSPRDATRRPRCFPAGGAHV